MDTPTTPPDSNPPNGNARVDPAIAGAPWWAYRRPPVAERAGPEAPATEPAAPTGSSPPGRGGRPPARPPEPQPQEPPTRASFSSTVSTALPASGVPAFALGASLVAATLLATRVLGNNSAGAWLLPAAGISFAVSFGHRHNRVHPEEPWLPQLLLLGVLAKLFASWVRYITLANAYDNVGDAARFDAFGRQLVTQWTGGQNAPVLPDLQQTNFMKWLTGVTYYLFGESLVGGFLLFGLLAVIGSYFWYRALVDAVPAVNRRLWFIFLMFAPSIVFWPSSLGKEALMQLAVGATAWATSLALQGRFLRGIPLAAGGAWLMWVIRPHLLALVALAAVLPYFIGKVGGPQAGSILNRPIGMVAVGLMAVLTVTAGARFLGIQKLSVESVQDQLNQETARSSEGGSSFSHGSNTLSPLAIPNDVVTVLFRPFIWESRSGLQLLASLESTAVIVLIVIRFNSVRFAFRRSRRYPFILYCLILLLLYSMTFSALANFGLLNRERSLALPALYAIIALEPALERPEHEVDTGPAPIPLRG